MLTPDTFLLILYMKVDDFCKADLKGSRSGSGGLAGSQ